ncbi:probable RNA polymerase II nuclear localization protein SLC7A6OS isoform X2 [Ceratina calcarata]|uniref:Probable RNA polymerase II nuclear localization protein SLC7A6OS n=1 Tax=Ceratina calcarata TaxID=156304 RepID=A0AAJ7IVZ0_9HYME|nr:probable RNA polymerase II nuclear localization protein SLC7A6OS isoform X1 [Ceratina calcarata]XP_017878536.1 probable RNA polymerase II nuclear localization protein SLC7A6OS isoform X2 [Ceratina calcarata]
MAAILRVKRRYTDEPLNALVISCKRQKTAENEEAETTLLTPVTTVAKFAGTVDKQEDSVEDIIHNYEKDKLKANFKQHPVDVLSKARKLTKHASAESRYKVVSFFRSLDNSNHEDTKEKCTTVIDIEDSRSMAEEESTEKDNNYVYDLYYAQTEDDIYLDDEVLVHPYEQELVFDNYRDESYRVECESEDSNSESNWRNDYPDSDHSERSINEDDMREAIMNMKINQESDLSDDDDFVYAIDEADVNAYGYSYARYKARLKEELGESEEDSLSEESVEDN